MTCSAYATYCTLRVSSILFSWALDCLCNGATKTTAVKQGKTTNEEIIEMHQRGNFSLSFQAFVKEAPERGIQCKIILHHMSTSHQKSQREAAEAPAGSTPDPQQSSHAGDTGVQAQSSIPAGLLQFYLSQPPASE